MPGPRLAYHQLLTPYAESYAATIAAVLGWRLLESADVERALARVGTNDRVALASVALSAAKQRISFSFRKSITPLLSGSADHHRLASNAAQQLLGHCWEILCIAKFAPSPTDPMLEFLRHLRNACFHGNAFHFYRGEPRNQAEWRGLTINAGLQGRRLFRANMDERAYFLNWGDPLVLLSDISEHLPPH